jgi:proteic killer suppression protein
MSEGYREIKSGEFFSHGSKGDRTGEFAMTVTRNYRLTFTKVDDRTISALDLEDYH